MRKRQKMKEETKRKISISKTGSKRRWFGRVPTSDQAKRNMSIAQKGKKRKPRPDEVKRKISITKTGKKRAPFSAQCIQRMRDSHLGKKNGPLSEEHKQKLRAWNVDHPSRKFKDTTIELKVEEELKKRGIIYEKQVPLCKVSLVDFYLPEYRIVIECDGCYWHGCKECNLKGAKNVEEKDKNKDSILTFNGFNVYRFWEHEINKDVEECINRLNINI